MQPITIIIKNRTTVFLAIYYFFIAIWWLVLLELGSINNVSNYFFAFFSSLVPFTGGIFGIINSRRWGFLKSIIGKSTFFISLGLITWAIGQIIFSYYNLFLNVEIPYPSLADASFILSWPLWGIGIFFLLQATGVKYGLREKIGKVLLLILPILVIVASYYLLVVIAKQGLFEFSGWSPKTFFDLAYPIGDVVILTMTTIVLGLSYKLFGGELRVPIYIILLGFIVNYFADFSFSYTTTLQTFYSGNWVDFLFTTAMFFISLGLSMLSPHFLDLEKKERA